MLTLAFITGTEPGKWFRRYTESTNYGLETTGCDDPIKRVQAGQSRLALTRLPDARVTDDYHVVRLYTETPGVAVPKGSVYAELGESLLIDDLSGDIVNYTYSGAQGPSIDELRTALQTVAANVGVAFAPKPLLKVLSKKQIRVLEVDGEPTEIALVWRKSEDDDEIQDFVGVAKGRTARSSRTSHRRR